MSSKIFLVPIDTSNALEASEVPEEVKEFIQPLKRSGGRRKVSYNDDFYLFIYYASKKDLKNTIRSLVTSNESIFIPTGLAKKYFDDYTLHDSTPQPIIRRSDVIADFTRALEMIVVKALGWNLFFKGLPKKTTKAIDLIKSGEVEGLIPKSTDVFRIFDLVGPSEIKVVIVGQDPYPGTDSVTGEPLANGIAFGSNSAKAPASLKNIYKAIVHDGYTLKNPNDHTLVDWVKQGVFLINKKLCLGSDDNLIPKDFTEKLFTFLAEFKPVVVLWGNHAKKYESLFEGCEIITGGHPSPANGSTKFEECGHPRKINELLQAKKLPVIEW